jgi:hypothetical protein
MVLVGRHHWTETVPAWPLLDALAGTRGFRRAITLAETIDDALAFLVAHANTYRAAP